MEWGCGFASTDRLITQSCSSRGISHYRTQDPIGLLHPHSKGSLGRQADEAADETADEEGAFDQTLEGCDSISGPSKTSMESMKAPSRFLRAGAAMSACRRIPLKIRSGLGAYAVGISWGCIEVQGTYRVCFFGDVALEHFCMMSTSASACSATICSRNVRLYILSWSCVRSSVANFSGAITPRLCHLHRILTGPRVPRSIASLRRRDWNLALSKKARGPVYSLADYSR